MQIIIVVDVIIIILMSYKGVGDVEEDGINGGSRSKAVPSPPTILLLELSARDLGPWKGLEVWKRRE
eukprot:3085355-Karenia_brevis.AAC.1